jgi:preprotein translocase subunit YajC
VNYGPLLTLVLIGAVFYLLLIAPQRRRQRQLREMTSQLEPGAQIMTTAGLYATVHAVLDDEVHLEVAPGVVSRYAKGAIARVIPPPEPAEDLDLREDADEAEAGGAAQLEPPGGQASTEGPGTPTEP